MEVKMVSYWSASLCLVILGSASAMVVPYGTGNGRGVDKQPFGVKSPMAVEDTNNELGYFEGDIAGIDFGQSEDRNAVLNMTLTWPGGIMPFVMSHEYSFYEKCLIHEAFAEYRRKTCIRFVPLTYQHDYINITKGYGCNSQIGRNGSGGQEVSIGSSCINNQGSILHEFMHAAGFVHEHGRADRDNYVIINWNNIKKGCKQNFIKFNLTEIQHLDEPYDFASIMHYSPYNCAINPDIKTIIPKDPKYGIIMGQRREFSPIDLKKINKLYKCKKNLTWRKSKSEERQETGRK